MRGAREVAGTRGYHAVPARHGFEGFGTGLRQFSVEGEIGRFKRPFSLPSSSLSVTAA